MRRQPDFKLLCVLPLLAGLAGCVTGELDSVAGAGEGTGSGGKPNAAASQSPWLSARIRRLSNAEYENSARALVGSSEPVTSEFAPDARQSGFTVNDAQRVDSVLVKQIAAAASKLAAEVRQKLDTLAPCADPAGQANSCAKTFIQSFASHAYRRPLASEEAQKLFDLYQAGAEGAAYADGIELVATGVLQSAAFLYLTEIGAGKSGSTVSLTPYETASAISYLVTANPPDAELLKAAADNQLQTPEQRSAAFARLVANAGSSGARERILRLVKEWLGLDRLADTAKDSTAYGRFAALKPAMLQETGDFVQRLVEKKSGTVGELLNANWTVTSDAGLIGLYDGTPSADGEISLPARRGILNQGAFLSVYAHASETAPVLRGVAVERRLACIIVPSPATLKLTVPPLAPDPNKTTRDRLSAHAVDPVCASCHRVIDSFGFTFEQYDGMGQPQVHERAHDTLNIDSHTSVAAGKDFDGDYADSNALASALSQSAAVRECFARNLFHASAGRSDEEVQGSERAFIDYWKTVPAPPADATHPTPASAAEGSILEALRAYITSPNFTVRRAQ